MEEEKWSNKKARMIMNVLFSLSLVDREARSNFYII